MRAFSAVLIVLSLSALALAGPAINKIGQLSETEKDSSSPSSGLKQTAAIESLEQWCFSSQMSQQELTASFKKLVNIVKSSPEDQSTESAVMSGRICQQAKTTTGTSATSTGNKSADKKSTGSSSGEVDAQAHELIKDVYMDSLIACESRQCMQQLIKIINSNKVDTIRASYYMTRIAFTEKATIKDDAEVKLLADSFIESTQQPASEAIERQKLFAVTSLLGKMIENSSASNKQLSPEIKQTAEQVAKTIVERYISPVSKQEVQQYKNQKPEEQSQEVSKKIAQRNAALKALANIPGYLLKELSSIQQVIVELAEDKKELVTVRQSAIECLEQNEQVYKQLKAITFDQEEPIEVRVAAYRALMTSAFAGMDKDEQQKEQMAQEIVEQVVKHCEEQRNQQQDDQFVMYAISHLDNLRTSQQPEHKAIKECIAANKQHYMQIQLLVKKFKQQLSQLTKSSRNYKLEQAFNQLESGLIVEGDLIYESKHKQQQQQQWNMLPKLIRVNMSMPVMGETVNVVEVTVRQSHMDEELLSALKLAQGAKFNTESVSKVVESFKSSVEQQRPTGSSGKPQTAEADLTIKVEGCTVVYVCVDDFKSSRASAAGNKRNTRSATYSFVDEIIEHLKRKPVAFNRGFNFNINERIAKLLDVEANIIAGLRFNSRATGSSSKDFEIVAQVEPRFAFEAIVGPAKLSSKKLLQRVSTKSALGLRLRFKQDELVEYQIDLPMDTMELFTVESQLVEKSQSIPYSYTYLPESIFGQEDIYSPNYSRYENTIGSAINTNTIGGMLMKRSIFENKSSTGSSIVKLLSGKQETTFAHTFETSEELAQTTGLRSKLRLVVSPKDMSFLLSCVCQKYDSRMEGYRVQVQQVQRTSEQQQYVLTISTPGSQLDRTLQLRIVSQSNSQRTLIKTQIQSPVMTITGQYELIHDGRQFALKLNAASTRSNQQWRHNFECGVQRNSQSQAGRLQATSFKPFLSIDSSSLKRPIQMQGVVSYQQQWPKSVIMYEFKCPTSGDFVQGKIAFEERQSGSGSSSSSSSKRSFGSSSQFQFNRRSMQSPIELLLNKDFTLATDCVWQVQEHSVKAHAMIDWDSSKWALKANMNRVHKNLRKSNDESQIVMELKLEQEQQQMIVERKCPQQQRKDFRLTVVSDCRQQAQHQMLAEFRSQQNQITAYKHKLDFTSGSKSWKQAELGYVIELSSTHSQRPVAEKFQGRTQVSLVNKVKSLNVECASRTKSAKLNVAFVSLSEHQIELQLQSEQLKHKTQVTADKRQLSVQSRTDCRQQLVSKIAIELLKQQGDCSIVIEIPQQNTHIVAELKLASGQLSTFALQTPRFASKAEFSFEKMARAYSNKHAGQQSFWARQLESLSPVRSMRFKTDLKDTISKQAYWMDSQLNAGNNNQANSYFRLDSPVYRTDLEFDPRDQSAKYALFARSKRSINDYQLYSNADSSLNDFDSDKLNLGANKLWMMRSFVSSPKNVNELKKQARRALFEYADRRQAHKHQFDYMPMEQRVKFNMDRSPIVSSSFKPIRLSGDFNTATFATANTNTNQQRPSSLSMASEWADFDMELQPFDGEQSFAKLTALSRHPRSAFKKHESEARYSKKHGYQAWMKHQDSDNQRHQWQLEADQEPHKWAKMSYDSDKHGKGQYEHQWHKKTGASSAGKHSNEQVYQNRVAFEGQSPASQKNSWNHRSSMQWEEPMMMKSSSGRRYQRSVQNERFGTLDYLKHIQSARLNSLTSQNQNELYNLDFDYQPESYARLNIAMPDDMFHASSYEFEPSQRLYKLQSSLINRRSQVPSYELSASTKPYNMASSEQEPLFFNHQHQLIERPIGRSMSTIFKSPLKLDYSDKFGRQARLDYDQTPLESIVANKYQGLRQKRAAIYYKDNKADFEHQSSYDFYPEAVLGFRQANRQSGDLVVKSQTKYGPVVMRADSNEQQVQLSLESPIFKAKLSGETVERTSGQLIKFTIDNKQQSVQLAKIVRKNPILSLCPLVEQLAKEIDQCRFEHQTELLVSIVDSIFKIKSQTMMDQRPVLVIEGEYNEQANKAVVKINGDRTQGQLVIDLVSKSAQLTWDVDQKRTISHLTRLVRVNDKFFALDSMTTYKGQPLFKLSGKVSTMILAEPKHLFARRQSGGRASEEHISTFEAVVFEPKKMQVSGVYDCLNKEARLIVKDVQSKKVSEISVQYDQENEDVLVDARTVTPRGVAFQLQRAINVAPFVKVY